MELKNMRPNNRLLKKELFEKKNWFILTAIILLVTVLILPLLLEMDMNESIVGVGIVEVFIIVFINCIIDFNYLHDTKKYGYYLSKPLGNVGRMHIVLISNLIFAAFFMTILFVIAAVANLQLLELFIPTIGWLVTIIMLSALSSYLSGNSIIAAVATWFNFAIPLMFLGIIYFAIEMVSGFAEGFNINIIMDYIVSEIYRLDIIYFFDFVVTENIFLFLVYLILLNSGLYLLTRWVIGHRRNEKIGQYIIFNGFKNFIAMIASLLVPFMFILIMPSDAFIPKLIAFILLGSITYYVAMIVLEKSFRIKRASLRVLGIFMIAFVLFVVGSGVLIKNFEDVIPETSKIQAVYIGGDRSFYDIEKDRFIHIRNLELEDRNLEGVRIYESEAMIDYVREIHQSIMDNADYHSYVDVNIIYFMKDGSKIRRYFSLKPQNDVSTYEDMNTSLDAIAGKMARTNEYWMENLPLIYDDTVAKEYLNGLMTINYEGHDYPVALNQDVLDGFRSAYQQDMFHTKDEQVVNLTDLMYRNYYPTYRDYVVEESVKVSDNFTGDMQVNMAKGEKNEFFYIPDHFDHTRQFLKIYIK